MSNFGFPRLRVVNPFEAAFREAGEAYGHPPRPVTELRDGERVRRLLLEGMARLAGREHGGALAVIAQNAEKAVVYGLLGPAFAEAHEAVPDSRGVPGMPIGPAAAGHPALPSSRYS